MAPKKGGSTQRHLIAKLVTENKKPCVFCQRDVNDEAIYGKLYAIGDIQCHYFCVLLSSCLVQRGKDGEGLFGFLYADIVAEVERSKKHKCSYCYRIGATLGCSISQCKKQFHLPCGRERQAISMFCGNYKSFCKQHAPKQSIPANIMVNAKLRMKLIRTQNTKKTHNNFSNLKELSTNNELQAVETESVCVICYEEVDGYPTLQTFWPPCCARDAWFHRSCLQRMALSAGMHYLKCPLCNDKTNFYQAVLSQGYYVPDRDAAWELEQNAFAEIYERSVPCDALECKCPMGRNHDADTGAWDMKLCILCGSLGVHVECSEQAAPAARHVCRVCRPAAPDNIDLLADTIEQVILAEQNQKAIAERSGPIMPCRMSLRRTKQRIAAQNIASSSTSGYNFVCETEKEIPALPTSRADLNLKTPRKPPAVEQKNRLKTIDNKTTPIKLLEQGIHHKIQNMGLKCADLNSQVMEVVRETLQKPKPLSVKKKIVDDILDGLLETLLKEHKQKELAKVWHSPKKLSDNQILASEEPLENNIKDDSAPLEDSRPPKVSSQKIQVDEHCLSTELTTPLTELNENVVDIPANVSIETLDELQIFDTPKKLKTIDIQKDSSLEISANDEVIKIDVIRMENVKTEPNKQLGESPVEPNKCTFKFSPSDKEILKNSNLDMDLENFKNHYLNEDDRHKCNFNHNHINVDVKNTKIRTAIDFALDATLEIEKVKLKRKLALDKSCGKKKKMDENSKKKTHAGKGKEKRKKDKSKNKDNIKFSMAQKENKHNKKLKTKLSIKNRNIQFKIKWKDEELDLKISKTKSKKTKKRKMKNKFKQFVLKFLEDGSSKDLLALPDKEVSPIKRRYIKHEKTPDNLKQTSIQSFFKLKTPME